MPTRIPYSSLPIPPEWGDQDPTTPVHGYFPDAPSEWMARHDRFNEEAEARRDEIKVVFLGDSITEGWAGAGQEIWNKRYAMLGSANFGIGGDRTQQILWRIAHGNLDHLTPKLVVLKIGVNNLWMGDAPAIRVPEGRALCVAAIQEKCPNAKILLLGVLPAGQFPQDPLRARVQRINDASPTLDNGKTVRYLDIGANFLQPDGSISAEIMPDFCHLSPAGYKIWADSMQPLFDEMIN